MMPVCLADAESAMSVKTLSKVQVRKFITKEALGAWRNYQAYLTLFID
jgi:hypothetical protein